MSTQAGEQLVIVHPDDINLADAKRLAADFNATVVGNRYVPRGQMFLMDASAARLPGQPT